ncbi:MAG: cobalt transporter [Rhodospirillales bacterium]|nr:cobalt transporter [Rhodospirillales bacterium]
MIHRVLTVGLLAGLLAGLLVATLQYFITTPLILAGEVYEAQEMATPPAAGHDMASMHDWKPADGIQRTAFTSIATIATSAGFALILLAGMLISGDAITVKTAFGWSVAAFVATGLAPSLGLAPELPGSAAGPLLARQIWWLGTAISTGLALWLFLRSTTVIPKLVAVALLAAPHLIGAPQPIAFESKAPAELAAHFVAASLTIQAALWILSGLAAGALWMRFNKLAPV